MPQLKRRGFYHNLGEYPARKRGDEAKPGVERSATEVMETPKSHCCGHMPACAGIEDTPSACLPAGR